MTHPESDPEPQLGLWLRILFQAMFVALLGVGGALLARNTHPGQAQPTNQDDPPELLPVELPPEQPEETEQSDDGFWEVDDQGGRGLCAGASYEIAAGQHNPAYIIEYGHGLHIQGGPISGNDVSMVLASGGPYGDFYQGYVAEAGELMYVTLYDARPSDDEMWVTLETQDEKCTLVKHFVLTFDPSR